MSESPVRYGNPLDPTNTKPPQEMVEVAKKFIEFYIHEVERGSISAGDGDDIDEGIDIAQEEWETWVGNAFNQALEELGLAEDD